MNDYARALYPLPPEVSAKRRKKDVKEREARERERERREKEGEGGSKETAGASTSTAPPKDSGSGSGGGASSESKKRHTVSGGAVVDLTRWDAVLKVNPAGKWARKSTKCLSTREWEVRSCASNTWTFRQIGLN